MHSKIENILFEKFVPLADRYIEELKQRTRDTVQNYIECEILIDDIKMKTFKSEVMAEAKSELSFILKFPNNETIIENILKLKKYINSIFNKAAKTQEFLNDSYKKIEKDFDNEVYNRIIEYKEDLNENVCVEFDKKIDTFVKKSKKRLKEVDYFSQNLSESFVVTLTK